MKRLSEISILACLVAGAMVVQAASLSGKALAGNGEPLQTQSTETQPRLGLADNKGDRLPTARETEEATAATIAERTGEATVTKAAATKSKPKGPQTEAVDKFGGKLLAQDKATDQTDDLLFPTKEEQRAIKAAQPEGAAGETQTANAGLGAIIKDAGKAAHPEGAAGEIDAHAALQALITKDAKSRGQVPGEQALTADAEADGFGQGSLLAAAARESKGKPSPIPAIDAETLSLYPTAAQCGECHKQIYEEWSSSQHAYASISPMFQKFEQKFTELTDGTVGTFCVRCHQQVGTQLGEKRETPLWQRSAISREGVTCITCHRVKDNYGKVNGERRVEPGTINEPVYGSGKGSVIKDILANKETYSVKTGPEGRGNDIHKGMILNPQISKSEFCVSCHQVAVNLGIKLEIVWDQYRDSPARKAGITCQDCHMGKVPGQAKGYTTAPSAIVGGKEINPGRKHANHRFVGPGYSIAHPGIFPHNKKAQAFSIKQWLQFNWRAGWGTRGFEDEVANGKIKVDFPQAWADSNDREEAWQVISENFAKLRERRKLRQQIMENSSKVDGPYIQGAPTVGQDLAFSYNVKNINTGHNLPSGSLGAQPQLWVNVALVDPDGKNVWESGYVDADGNMADLHSLEVAQNRIAIDQQLVHFQTKFLTTNIKGTDREMYLPVNFDIDQLPQLRAPQIPTTVLNHPPLVRMENHSLTPLGEKTAAYTVPGDLIKKPGKYRLAFRMRSRSEPIYFMRFVRSTKEMEQRMNEWMMDFHAFAVEVDVKG